jgi:hypothetical protein
MATVPGPQPDRPLPTPGAPEAPPYEREEEDRRVASPPDRQDTEPDWMPEPYSPEREQVEPDVPAGVP